MTKFVILLAVCSVSIFAIGVLQYSDRQVTHELVKTVSAQSEVIQQDNNNWPNQSICNADLIKRILALEQYNRTNTLPAKLLPPINPITIHVTSNLDAVFSTNGFGLVYKIDIK